LCSILKYEGYLPYDRSGDYVYQGCEVLAALMAAVALFLIFVAYRGTYQEDLDNFGAYAGVPSAAGIIVAVVPCLLLAALLHPSLNNVWFTDVSWTFACYLETLALFPQLVFFSRQTRSSKRESGVMIDAHISHFVFAIAAGRMLHFIFWIASYHELNDKYHATHVGRNIGLAILLSQIAHLIILADYFYYYITAAIQGTQLVLPDRGPNLADVV
jgi:heme/copper-type cytochrome/quinol oxidase subunit 2